MKAFVLNVTAKDVAYLDAKLLTPDGQIGIWPASHYADIPHEHLIAWCNLNAIYSIPTIELVSWLHAYVAGRKVIEIGAGNGVLARSLGFVATDSCQQGRSDMIDLYKAIGQKTIKYGKNVNHIAANAAVKVYKPQVVYGCWVTQLWRSSLDKDGNAWGIDEEAILEDVDAYVVIGNQSVHGNKRIMSKPHKELSYPWLLSRAMNHTENRIYIWER